MPQVLNETFITKGQIVESNREKLPKGVLCRGVWPICNVGKLNRNNRMYEKAVFEKAIFNNQQIQEAMKNRTLFGHAEHPDKSQSDLQLTSHVIIDTFIKEQDGQEVVYQTFDILDTPCGRIVNTLLEAGCAVGCSTRAEGDLEEAQDPKIGSYYRVVPESYHYITTDFTADPSTYGSKPIEVIREIKNEIDSGLLSESEKCFAVSLMEAFQRVQQEKHMNIKEAVDKKILKEGSTILYQGKTAKVVKIQENLISVQFDNDEQIVLQTTDSLQVKVEADKIEVVNAIPSATPSADTIPMNSEDVPSELEAAPTATAASEDIPVEEPVEDTTVPTPSEEDFNKEEEQKEEEQEEEVEEDEEGLTKESVDTSPIKRDIHQKDIVVAALAQDGSILYGKAEGNKENLLPTLKKLSNLTEIKSFIETKSKPSSAKDLSRFFVDLGGSNTAYLFDGNKWWYLSANKGGMLVPAYNERVDKTVNESITVGSTVQITDKEGNVVFEPKAKVYQIDTAVGLDGEDHLAIEVTGSDDEDQQMWFTDEQYDFILLESFNSNKKPVKESFDEFVEELKARFATLSLAQKAKIASILPCRVQEEVASPSKASLLKESLQKAELQTALEHLDKVEKEKEQLKEQYELQLKVLADKIKENQQREREEISSLRKLLEQKGSLVKQLQQQIKEQEQKSKQQIIKQYIDIKTQESRFPLPSSSRALLEKCSSISEVDKLFEEIRAALRRQTLSLAENGTVRIEQNEFSKDPLLTKIRNVIDSL